MGTPGTPPTPSQRTGGSQTDMRKVLRPNRLICKAPLEVGPSPPGGDTVTEVMWGAHSGHLSTSARRRHPPPSGAAPSNTGLTVALAIQLDLLRLAAFRPSRTRPHARYASQSTTSRKLALHGMAGQAGTSPSVAYEVDRLGDTAGVGRRRALGHHRYGRQSRDRLERQYVTGPRHLDRRRSPARSGVPATAGRSRAPPTCWTGMP